ncbi:MAG: hypothetical protein IH860_06995 [Chloroflexi bacterium]|nr:hypothetical protein [Chloroflexota bacterium]MCH8090092.1 hypothetical protein [Chloroflexota bacterium]MCH9037045.1 hypothetical protein [Chloroflexota bacterium]
MASYRFERECRTPYSEAYTIVDGETPVGRVDLHFTTSVVHATLNVLENITQDGIQELIDAMDEELVMTADAARGDFIVAVYQGRDVGVFSDEDFDEEEEEDKN